MLFPAVFLAALVVSAFAGALEAVEAGALPAVEAGCRTWASVSVNSLSYQHVELVEIIRTLGAITDKILLVKVECRWRANDVVVEKKERTGQYEVRTRV